MRGDERAADRCCFRRHGFLGRNIVAHLRTKGLAVRVVARHPGRAERMFGEPRPELSYQAGDLLDERSTRRGDQGAPIWSLMRSVFTWNEAG